MLLAIDIGNTQTVIGMFGPAGPNRSAPSELLHHWRISTSAERTADEMALLLAQLLDLQGFAIERTVTGIAVASVVPRLRAGLREMTEKWFPVKTVIVEPGIRTGMPILYDNPKEVGADRIADAVAAYEAYGGPTIVIDFGTATTFEAISAKGEYLGGAIIHGIEISLDALFGRAAALTRVELVEPRNVIGKNTVESIQSGTVYGFAAQVDGLCARFEEELGECTVVATGGLAGLIAPLTESIDHHDPWLTLHGLRIIYDRNTDVPA
jgi:type III pantothenate kinase